MYNRILVPLDGSVVSEIVLPYVEEIASRVGSEVFLVSVSKLKNDDIDNIYERYLDRLVVQVQCELEDFKAKKETKINHEILTGKTANEILRYAEEGDMDLIAIAASGGSGEGPWLLGNTAAKILRATTRSVFLVRSPASEEDIQRRSLIKKALVPLDGSELGESAIPKAEALGKILGAELVLLHVMEPIITAAMPGLASVTIPTPGEAAKRTEDALEYLGNIEARLRAKGLNASSELRSGSAAEEIVTLADESDIDLVALSTHGRSGIGRWVFGSVTDKVLHAGNTPVLIVRTSEH